MDGWMDGYYLNLVHKILMSIDMCSVQCGEKSIREAYHVICRSCASGKRICSKCLQSFESNQKDTTEIKEAM